ncbi:MAG: hypothetical protein FJX74_02600 [Armatimonadetes bacterium]|nr:hypothetical protein [Armatimonadota bacterium]
MHGHAPRAGHRLQVTGDRKPPATTPTRPAVPITYHQSPVTSTVGFIHLPRFQAEVEAKLLDKARVPLAIHQRGRIISVCESGEAAGLQIGMRLHQAQAVCPSAEFVPLVIDRYEPFWREVLDLCVAHLGSVEPGEPGEVFVDLAGLKRPEEALAPLQVAVETRTGLTCRTACGPSKFVAKLGTGTHFGHDVRQKWVPVPNFALQDFLDPLPITELWPLDPKTLQQLQALGIPTIGLLRRIPLDRLAEHFGREARRLQDLARGLDHSPVRPLYPLREVVVRRTLPDGTDNPEALDRCLNELAGKAAAELRRRQEVCGQVALCATPEAGAPSSSSLRLRDPSHDERDLLRACRVLVKRLRPPAPISALTLKASDCRRDTGRQLDLFYDNRALARRRQRTSQALEVIRECFGHDIAILGAEMELPRRERVLAALGN